MLSSERMKILKKFKELEDWALVNTSMAAAVLDVSASFLTHCRGESDAPPYVRLRYLVRYRKKDLIEWIMSQQTNGRKDAGNEQKPKSKPKKKAASVSRKKQSEC